MCWLYVRFQIYKSIAMKWTFLLLKRFDSDVKTFLFVHFYFIFTNKNDFHCSNHRYSLKAFVSFNSNSNPNPNWIQLFSQIQSISSVHTIECYHNQNQKPIPMGKYLIEEKTEIEKSHAMSGNDRNTKGKKNRFHLKILFNQSLANWALNTNTCLFWTQKTTLSIQAKFSTKFCSEDPISISNNNKYRITKFHFQNELNVNRFGTFAFGYFFTFFSSIHLRCSIFIIRFSVGWAPKFWICSRIQFFFSLVYLLSVFLLSHSNLPMNALHMNQFWIQLLLFFNFLRWFFGFIVRNCCWFTVHA